MESSDDDDHLDANDDENSQTLLLRIPATDLCATLSRSELQTQHDYNVDEPLHDEADWLLHFCRRLPHADKDGDELGICISFSKDGGALTSEAIKTAVQDACEGHLRLRHNPVALRCVDSNQFIGLPVNSISSLVSHDLSRDHQGARQFKVLYVHDAVPVPTQQAAGVSSLGALFGVWLFLVAMTAAGISLIQLVGVQDVRHDFVQAKHLLAALRNAEQPHLNDGLKSIKLQLDHDMAVLRDTEAHLKGLADLARIFDNAGEDEDNGDALLSTSQVNAEQMKSLALGIQTLNSQLEERGSAASRQSASYSHLAAFAKQNNQEFHAALQRNDTQEVLELACSWWQVFGNVFFGSRKKELTEAHAALSSSMSSLHENINAFHRREAALRHLLISSVSATEQLEDALQEVADLVQNSPLLSGLLVRVMNTPHLGGLRTGLWLDRLGFTPMHTVEAVLRGTLLPPSALPLALCAGRFSTLLLSLVTLLAGRLVYSVLRQCVRWAPQSFRQRCPDFAPILLSASRAARETSFVLSLWIDLLSLIGLLTLVAVPSLSVFVDGVAASVGTGVLLILGSVFIGSMMGFFLRLGISFVMGLPGWMRHVGAVRLWSMCVLGWTCLAVYNVEMGSGWETPEARQRRRHDCPAVLLEQFYHGLAAVRTIHGVAPAAATLPS